MPSACQNNQRENSDPISFISSVLPRRTRVAAFMIALTLFAVPVAAVSGDEYQELGVIGKWRLTTPLDGADITSLDDREAQQLVGRIFTIDKNHVRFGKRDCGPPELTADLVDPVWYLREKAHTSAELLHLPSPVTVVRLGCTIAFIKNPKTIVLLWKGWFFDARRVR